MSKPVGSAETGSQPTGNPGMSDSLSAYRACFKRSWQEDAALNEVRFVVLDCETTGLDARRHRIVSIGAVGIVDCQIDLGDSFEALLRVRFNTDATLVHGITRHETRAGMAEVDAMARLLHYLRDGVIVGHHIGHDLAMLDAALARHGDGHLHNHFVDTGELALLLEGDGAFGEEKTLTDLSLDGLCTRFGVVPYDRHTAPGDAFLTAQVFLRLLRLAARHGRGTLGRLWTPTQDASSLRPSVG
ncbi:MAG: 3'-5' exonuclease [Thiohalocapsa sp.]